MTQHHTAYVETLVHVNCGNCDGYWGLSDIDVDEIAKRFNVRGGSRAGPCPPRPRPRPPAGADEEGAAVSTPLMTVIPGLREPRSGVTSVVKPLETPVRTHIRSGVPSSLRIQSARMSERRAFPLTLSDATAC